MPAAFFNVHWCAHKSLSLLDWARSFSTYIQLDGPFPLGYSHPVRCRRRLCQCSVFTNFIKRVLGCRQIYISIRIATEQSLQNGSGSDRVWQIVITAIRCSSKGWSSHHVDVGRQYIWSRSIMLYSNRVVLFAHYPFKLKLAV